LIEKLNAENQQYSIKLKELEKTKEENQELRNKLDSRNKPQESQKEQAMKVFKEFSRAAEKKAKDKETQIQRLYHNRCNECKIDEVKEELEWTGSIADCLVLYIIVVTVISILKNKNLRTDIEESLKFLWIALKSTAIFFYNITNKTGSLVFKICSGSVANVLHWIAVVLLLLIVLVILFCCLRFIAPRIKELFKSKWDTVQTVITIAIASVIIYFSDVVNSDFYGNMNLIILFLIAFTVSVIVRIIKATRR
jgi:hypothetical protein